MAVILITGSSTGIGYVTAEALARLGHTVYATMRDPIASPQLQKLADNEKLPITILTLDVLDDQSVQNAVKTILDQQGRIDILINNAGIHSWGAVEELSMESFEADMATNYFGLVRCIKAVLPSMRERRNGRIINMSSIAGKVFSNFHSSYCSSKAAVEAMSESLAQELAPFNIEVSLIQPAFIETPIFKKTKTIPSDTKYPNGKRFLSLFAASLENHESPGKVAEAIVEIVSGKNKSFRIPVGMYAAGFLNFRSSMPDENWVNSVSIKDNEWSNGMEQMGLKVAKYMQANGMPQFNEA